MCKVIQHISVWQSLYFFSDWKLFVAEDSIPALPQSTQNKQQFHGFGMHKNCNKVWIKIRIKMSGNISGEHQNNNDYTLRGFFIQNNTVKINIY